MAYDSPPWWYDIRGFFILTFAYNNSLTRLIKFFAQNFGQRHIDIGCGTGTLLGFVLRFRSWKKMPPTHVVGVDYAEPMLEGARKRFASNPDIELVHADAGSLPFNDASFDTASIANALHCFPEVDKALQETFRVLKPGGIMAVNVVLDPRGSWALRKIAKWIYNWGMRKGILFKAYDQAEIRQKILNAGFAINSESTAGNCYYIVASKKI